MFANLVELSDGFIGNRGEVVGSCVGVCRGGRHGLLLLLVSVWLFGGQVIDAPAFEEFFPGGLFRLGGICAVLVVHVEAEGRVERFLPHLENGSKIMNLPFVILYHNEKGCESQRVVKYSPPTK